MFLRYKGGVLARRGGFLALKYMLYFLLCAVLWSKFSRIVTMRPVCSMTGGGGGSSGTVAPFTPPAKVAAEETGPVGGPEIALMSGVVACIGTASAEA